MRAVLAVMVLAMASSAAAQTPQNEPAAKAPPPATVSPATVVAPKAKVAEDPNKLVCKSEPVLGSRLSVKHCTTVGEAAVEKIEQRQALERMQGSTYQH